MLFLVAAILVGVVALIFAFQGAFGSFMGGAALCVLFIVCWIFQKKRKKGEINTIQNLTTEPDNHCPAQSCDIAKDIKKRDDTQKPNGGPSRLTGIQKKESKVFFFGQTLQSIGQILEGKEVCLSLSPEDRVLNIRQDKTTNITLPYDRIMSFVLENESTCTNGGNAGLRALAGGALFGTTGALIGAASAKNKTTKRWIGVLTYKDKAGLENSLAFLQTALLKPYDGDVKHYGAAQFEKIVNEIASKNRETITEL